MDRGTDRDTAGYGPGVDVSSEPEHCQAEAVAVQAQEGVCAEGGMMEVDKIWVAINDRNGEIRKDRVSIEVLPHMVKDLGSITVIVFPTVSIPIEPNLGKAMYLSFHATKAGVPVQYASIDSDFDNETDISDYSTLIFQGLEIWCLK